MKKQLPKETFSGPLGDKYVLTAIRIDATVKDLVNRERRGSGIHLSQLVESLLREWLKKRGVEPPSD